MVLNFRIVCWCPQGLHETGPSSQILKFALGLGSGSILIRNNIRVGKLSNYMSSSWSGPPNISVAVMKVTSSI